MQIGEHPGQLRSEDAQRQRVVLEQVTSAPAARAAAVSSPIQPALMIITLGMSVTPPT